MKIITKKYNTYTFDELDQEAKDKAREEFNKDSDYPFLTDDLREYIHEELKELGYKVIGTSTSENPSIRPYYDLSYSQGSGLMFEGIISDKKGNTYNIIHNGNYTNERSTTIVGTDKNDEYIDTKDFEENVYIPLCERIRDRGYSEIEYMDSEENFQQVCEANDFVFLKDGTIFNA